MDVIAIVVVGIGLILVLLGAIVTIVDWHDHRAASKQSHPGVEGRELGLDTTITALQKLLAELAKHPLGTRLIVLGMVLVLIGGVLGGVSGITS
jgi:predicted RND superfamily exporter protein